VVSAAGGANRILIRPTTLGIVASACLLAADLVWLALVRPPGLPLLVAWFGVLAVLGAFLPGLANQVTLARAHLAAPALVYSLLPSRLVQLAAVVSLAGLSDLVDGAIARRTGGSSRVGGGLDPVVDGVFFGVVAVGLFLGGAYPWWLALVVIVRYGLPAVVGAGLVLAGRRPKLQHTPMGQVSTTLIGVLLGGLALLRGLGLPTDALLTISEVVLPVAALATFVNLLLANRPAIVGSSAPRR
jgi:phosphatidylglycerophosphate synthase